MRPPGRHHSCRTCKDAGVQHLSTLIFDLDGTLYVNRELGQEIHLAACRYMAGVLAVDVTEADRLLREAKRRLSDESGWDSSLSAACLALGGDMVELHRHFAQEIDPEPFLNRDERVVRLLESLAVSYGLYIYTNNNRPLAGRIMGALGIAGYFRRAFTIEDGWRPKPDLPTLDQIYATIGSEPAHCLFIGDRYDIDLRLPQQMGSSVYLSTTLDDLLSLETFIDEENL
jgi:putative hydrolase of the HAD superfamily